MRVLGSLAAFLGSGLCAALPAFAQVADRVEEWRAVCDDFQANYSYTEYKGLNWTAIFETNRAEFTAISTAEEFAERLNQALLALHDWHVAVQKPDGTFIGYSPEYPRNYPAALRTNYSATGYANLKGSGALIHATLTNGSAHVIIPTLDTATFDTLTDADLLAFFEESADAKGLVVDLRYNSGGNELHARRVASFFVNRPTVYGYFRTRDDSQPDGFAALSEKLVNPHASLHIGLPVVVLTGQRVLSSAEWLTLMLREAPNAILMGDRTRGGSGNPALRAIPELGVSYLMSRWEAYTPEREIFEDRGIAPAIQLRPEASYDDATERDLLLEHAMEYLDWRYLGENPTEPLNKRSDSDNDRALDVDEFLTGTNPYDPGSIFAISVSAANAGPIRINWDRIARRRYSVQFKAEANFPWQTVRETTSEHAGTSLFLPAPGRSGIYRIAVELAP